MAAKSAPQLYKFISCKRLLSILREPAIRFTTPPFLNDPYECHLTLDVAKVLNDYREFRREKQPEIPEEDLNTILAGMEELLIHENLKRYKELRKSFGVLSLTEDPYNLLMWAHYGDEHCGAVIELDIGNPAFRPESPGGDKYATLEKVVYQDEKIADIPCPESLVRVLSTKSKHWEYEKEWRLIKTTNMLHHDKADIYLQKFSLTAIKKIFLGARFPWEHVSEVKEALSKTRAAIELVKLEQLPDKFELKEVSLDRYVWGMLHLSQHFEGVIDEARACLAEWHRENGS